MFKRKKKNFMKFKNILDISVRKILLSYFCGFGTLGNHSERHYFQMESWNSVDLLSVEVRVYDSIISKRLEKNMAFIGEF